MTNTRIKSNLKRKGFVSSYKSRPQPVNKNRGSSRSRGWNHERKALSGLISGFCSLLACVCVCVCVCVYLQMFFQHECLCTTCILCLNKPEECDRSRLCGTRVLDPCKLSCKHGNYILRSLQEQPVLLTAETSLQLLN